MNEMRIGKGCGKSGLKDKPKTMLTNVNANVKTLRRLVSSERSLASFSLNFFQRCLIHAGPLGIAAFVWNFNRDNLKPYFIKPFLKLVMVTAVETTEVTFDVIESIRKHVAQLKPLRPKRNLQCTIKKQDRRAARKHYSCVFMGRARQRFVTRPDFTVQRFEREFSSISGTSFESAAIRCTF